MTKLKQKVVYEVCEKHYDSYVEAESAIVDMLGEEVDDMFKGIDTGSLVYTAHSKMLIQVVEKMWQRREKLIGLLSLDYQPSGYIQELIEDSKL